MPPPAAYLSISAFPYSRVITQAEFNGGTYGDVANEVWFQLTIAAPTVVGFYVTIGGTFSPRWDLYESDGSTVKRIVNDATNPSWYYPLTAADTYYLQVTRRGGGASNFDFTFHADERPLNDFDIPTGSIIVNDDIGTLLPAAVLNPITAEVIGYIDIPPSEHGAMLPSGESVWYDRFGRYDASGTFAIFDANREYRISTSQVFNDPPSITSSSSAIFVLETTSGEVYSLNLTTGAATLVATVASPTTTSIGVNARGTILYYVDASDYINAFNPSDNVIHTWDLSTDSALPDLYTEGDIATDVGGFAVTPNFWTGEILVLPDGSIVTWARNEDAGHDILLHISSAGALLHSYTYNHASRQINHIAYLNNGSDSILAWFYAPSDSDGIITGLTLADGSETNPLSLEMFSSGVNNTGNTSTAFGISNSCTIVIVGAREQLSLTVPEECCPCDCPEPRGPHGSPSSAPLPSHAGPILLPVDPLSWIPQCTGGGDVPTAADATDPESWVQ